LKVKRTDLEINTNWRGCKLHLIPT